MRSSFVISCILLLAFLGTTQATWRLIDTVTDLSHPESEHTSWVMNPANSVKAAHCKGSNQWWLGSTDRGAAGNTQKVTYTKTFHLAQHFQLHIKFKVMAFGSTDGCGQGTPTWNGYGPDYYRVIVDNVERLAKCDMQSYLHGIRDYCIPASGLMDQMREDEFWLDHTATTLTIQFVSDCSQPHYDEAYGFRELSIQLYGGPPAECLTGTGANCDTCHATAVRTLAGDKYICGCPSGTSQISSAPVQCTVRSDYRVVAAIADLYNPETQHPAWVMNPAHGVKLVHCNGEKNYYMGGLTYAYPASSTIRTTYTKTFPIPAGHVQLHIKFKVMGFGSTDGCGPGTPTWNGAGPDYYRVLVDGVERLAKCDMQSYKFPNICGIGGGDLARYDEFIVDHRATSVTITLVSDAGQTHNDEAYGFRELLIEIIGGPQECVVAASTTSCETCDATASKTTAGAKTTCSCPTGVRQLTTAPVTCSRPCPFCGACDNAGSCTTCPANSVKVNSNTCQCNAGFYASSFNPIVCSPCSQDCAQCSGGLSSQCTACANGAVRQDLATGHFCVCPSGTYASSHTPLKCSPCHSSCHDCSGPSDSQCTSCNNPPCNGCGTMKFLGGHCFRCDPFCLDCASTTNCTTCSANALIVKTTTGATCACANGFYRTPNSLPIQCAKCHASCVTCASGDVCTQCQPTAVLTTVGTVKHCTCAAGHYVSAASPVSCGVCHPACTACTGPNANQCTACVAHAAHTGTTCTLCDASCSTCSGGNANQCLSCPAGTVLTDVAGGKACKCPSGSYQTSAAGKPVTCAKCDLSCKECNGAGPEHCTSCLDTAIIASGKCHCPDGTFLKSASPYHCEKCDTSCSKCNAAGANGCTACAAPSKLEIHDAKAQNGKCYKCHARCKDCNGEGENHCTVCPDRATLTDISGGKTCSCATGFFSETSAPLNCQTYKCHASCATCHGPHVDHCNSCPSGTELQKDGTCKSPHCHANCLTCTKSDSEHDCTTCVPGAANVKNGNSQDCKCVEGYFPASTSPLKCTVCDRTCHACSSATTCTTCPADAQLNSATHKCECKHGFHDEPTAKHLTCNKCPVNCESCTSNTTCTGCTAGFELVAGHCIKCHGSCKHCNGEGNNKCTACSDGAKLVDSNGGKTCVCDDGSFTLKSDPLTCSKCHGACKACTSNTENTCTKCADNAHLLAKTVNNKNGNTCVCSDGFAASSQNPLKCDKCHASCKTCSGTGDNHCTSCPADHGLSGGKCVKCDASCKTCDGTSDHNCLSCPDHARLATVTGGHQCHCDPGFFAASKTPLICKSCDGHCKECAGSTSINCTVCELNANLTAISTGGHECRCNAGYFTASITPLKCTKCDSSCHTCSGLRSFECTSCDNNKTLVNGSCIRCHPLCGDCNGEGADHCTKCPVGAEIVKTEHGQTCKCKEGLASVIQGPLKCEAYKCHASCRTCSGPKDSECTACAQGFVLAHGSCKAIDCDSTCVTCNGTAANQCLTCPVNAELKADHTCHCKDGSYPFTVKPLRCEKCHASCVHCSREGLACDKCVDNAVVHDGKCQCFPGFFANTAVGFKCDKCHATCHECSGPHADQCTSCPAGEKLANGKCIKCDVTCADCDGEGSHHCTKCGDNQQLVSSAAGHACQCAAGFYSKTASPLKCEKYTCHEDCETCHGPENNQCDTCPEGFKVVNGNCVSLKCHANCAACHGETEFDCSFCTSGAHLVRSNKDSSKRVCECQEDMETISLTPLKCAAVVCDPTCATCSGRAGDQCKTCHENADAVKNGEKTSCKCKDGFVFTKKSCEKCYGSCKTCKGVNHNECTSCPTGDKTIASKLIDGKCIKCDSSCHDCSGDGPYACTSCEAPFVLTTDSHGKSCKCAAGYSGLKCDVYKCDATCHECTGPHSNQCKSCGEGKKLENGQCIDIKCDKSCLTCTGPRDSDCTKCDEHHELRLGQNKTGKCDCKPGTTLGTDGKCAACDSSCKFCDGLGSKKCTGCLAGASLHAGECTCDAGTFHATTQPFHCDKCHAKCVTCKGPTENDCLTCHKEEKLVTVSGHSKCVKCDHSCVDCSDEGHHCSKCDASAHLIDSADHGKICACPDGSFKSGDSPLQCRKCNIDCKTCTGAGDSQCILCNDPHAEHKAHADGTSKCECKHGFYATAHAPLKCEALKCDASCADCSAPGADKCTACPKGSNLHEGKCLKFECDPSCHECTGPKATECTACTAGAELTKDHKCACKPGFHEKSKKPFVCEQIKCHHSCKTCSGPNDNECLTCWRNGQLQHDDKCECPLPNIEWQTSPTYICDTTYVDYMEAAEDENQK